MPRRILSLIVLLFATASSLVMASGDWPQWRGPDGAGVADNSGLPVQWTPKSPEVMWRTAVEGTGRSSPIVSRGRAILTTATADNAAARALDLVVVFLALAVAVALWRRRALQCRVWIAWLLFGVATSACLVNDFERVNRPMLGIPAVAALVAVLAIVSWWNWRGTDWRAATWLVLLAALGITARIVPAVPARYVYFVLALTAVLPLALPRLKYGWREQAGTWLRRAAIATVLTSAVAVAILPHLFWGHSPEAHIWTRAAVIAGAGLVAAALRMKSWTNLAAVALLVAAGLFYHFTPLTGFDIAYPPWKRAVAVLPLVTGAGWLLAGRRRDTPVLARNWAALPLAALALAVTWRATLAFPGNQASSLQVIALDARTGAIVWRTVVSRESTGRLDDPRASAATPTPATNGDVIVAHFGGVTACLEWNGGVRWKQSNKNYAQHVLYGAASSPVLLGDRVIMIEDRERADRRSYAAAYDLRSGRPIWRVEPDESRNSYATPVIWRHGGSVELVAITWRSLMALDPATGARRWQTAIPQEEMVASAVADGDRIYLSGGSMAAATMAMEAAGQSVSEAWRAMGGQRGCASPLMYRGWLFTVSQSGVASCYRATDGKLQWKARLASGEYFSSLAAADGVIYVASHEGVVSAFAAADEFRLLGRSAMKESVFASPAIADGALFLRTDEALYRIGRPPAAGETH